MLTAGALLLLYQAIRDPKSLKLAGGAWGTLALLAIFNIYLTNAMEFWGLKYLTSFKTCFIYSLSPFMAAFLSYLILNETMTGKKWLGLAIGFTGFIPILMSHSGAEESLVVGNFLSLPEIAVMVAAVASSYGWILLRKLVTDGGYTAFTANGYSMAAGGMLALIHSRLVEPWDPVPVTEVMPFITCTLVLIVISNVFAYNMYGWLLRRFTATFMSFAGFSTPLIAALFGWLFLGEVITSSFFLSAAVVFVGLLIFYQEELRHGVRVDDKAIEASS